jgi:hypothetical protein
VTGLFALRLGAEWAAGATSGVSLWLFAMVCLLSCLVCYYLAVDDLKRIGERVLATLFLYLPPFGFFYAYFFGWFRLSDRRMLAVMIVWTLSIAFGCGTMLKLQREAMTASAASQHRELR